MSMWTSLARVSAAAFSQIQKEPSLLDAIFFDDDAAATAALASLGIAGDHTAGFDYRLAYEALVAMAEATGQELDEDGDPVLDDLSVTGELDYDAGYGPAFYIDPAGVKKAVDSFACQLDEEVQAVIEGAAAAGDYLVGVIS